MKVSAKAFSNIALIKYWGRAAGFDPALNLPLNDTVSMTKYGLLDDTHLMSHTTIDFSATYEQDIAILNGKPIVGRGLERILSVIDPLRKLAGNRDRFYMKSHNDFPTKAGLASSASGFAALAVAASNALDLKLSPEVLSTYVRLGSGSAARSVFGGFVYFHKGNSHETSYAEKLCTCAEFDLCVVIAVVDADEKKVSSDEGHQTAETSPFNDIRIAKSQEQAVIVKNAILNNDFTTVGRVAEENCKYMHAVMMTSNPPLFYWSAATMTVIKSIMRFREEGLECYFTIDAGPNVHCLCHRRDLDVLKSKIGQIHGVKKVIPAIPADDVIISDDHLF